MQIPPGNELIDVDCACRFDINRLEVLVGDFDVAFAFADLVPFHDVVRRDEVPSLGIDLLEVDAIPGPFVELVEGTFSVSDVAG